MNKSFLYILFGFIVLSSCKKDDDGGYTHNPSNPITVNAYSPMEGSTGTVLLINGSNFSSDTAAIKVSINGVPLKVINAKENQILAAIMQKTGSGKVKVTIGGKDVESADAFNYKFAYVVTTLAGSGNRGYNDAKGTSAQFNFDGVRAQLSVDDNGNVYVPDGGNQRIRKVAPDGTVTTIAGTGENGFQDGPAMQAKFNNPCGTAVDANGNIYVSERNGRRIRKIAPDGTVSTHANPGGNGGNELTSVVINKSNGKIYWSDFYGDGVYENRNGTVQRVINFSLPCTITIDPQGNIYSTHYDAQTVRKYTYNSTTNSFDNGVNVAGKDGTSGFADGIGTDARFNNPWGIAIDKEGTLYVSGLGEGRNSNNVRRIDAVTKRVTTVAGSPDSGFGDATGTNAKFNGPTGIAVDKNGDLYVLDMANQRIRKITIQ